MRSFTGALLCAGLLCIIPAIAVSQHGAGGAPGDDTTTLDTIHVTAPRPETVELYRSRPPVRTPPTVFDRAWREPFNLQKIGDEGGVVPILVRYTARKVAETARRIPGWKGPDQPAVARPPPLNEEQMQRAMRMQDHGSGSEP